MTALTLKQKKHLKGLAHNLKPVVTVGQKGLQTTVLDEIDRALAHHELIKIKLPAGERDARAALLDSICSQSRAELVTLIGRSGVIYRNSDENNITLP
ncbi:MAG: ribosome assembly RNA-binding protein YhbY [Acidiferrobacterales bacterium]|nr:ribosome assembly RNA-binding protein YhbY [Acidiferrobacterales bacterium]